LEHWWGQRVSAVALAMLTVWLAICLLSISGFDYENVRTWMSRGWNAMLMILLILVAAHHSYLGLRVVVEDYVSMVGRRTVTVVTLRFAHGLLAAGGVFAVLEVSLAAG
jgi:succinate dehydrogenase / fumarate reductase membrane anchor subunit